MSVPEISEFNSQMKRCSYCGRDNQAEAFFCEECGTQIIQSVPTKPSRTRDLSGLKDALKYTGLFFVGLSFYLLSLGPVTRIWAKRTVTRTPTTVTVATHFPPLIGKIYMPAFRIASVPGLGELYSQYLELWAPLETPAQGE